MKNKVKLLVPFLLLGLLALPFLNFSELENEIMPQEAMANVHDVSDQLNLTGDISIPGQIRLTWNRITDIPNYTGGVNNITYSIERDGVEIGHAYDIGQNNFFIDNNPLMGQPNHYKLIAHIPDCQSCSGDTVSSWVGRGGGCFFAGTDITLADGTTKDIEKIRAGDELLSPGGQVNLVLGASRIPLSTFGMPYVINDEVEFTPEHPFLVKKENGEIVWKIVDQNFREKNLKDNQFEAYPLDEESLQVGDILITENGETEIKTLEQNLDHSEIETVYNIAVRGNQIFYADGYAVRSLGITEGEMWENNPYEIFQEKSWLDGIWDFFGINEADSCCYYPWQVAKMSFSSSGGRFNVTDQFGRVVFTTSARTCTSYRFTGEDDTLLTPLGPVCGAAAQQAYCSTTDIAPADLCIVYPEDETVTASAVIEDSSQSKPFVWTCSALGYTINCGAAFDTDCGSGCGSFNGATGDASSIFVHDLLCADQVTTEPFLSNNYWQWQCNDRDSSSNVTCLASSGQDTGGGTGGACGSANGTTSASAPTSGLCARGGSSNVIGSTERGWNWTCSLDGVSVGCSAAAPEDNSGGGGTPVNVPSICGPANGASFSSEPSGDILCNFGTPTEVIGEGGWWWQCEMGAADCPTCMAIKDSGKIAIIGQSRSDSLSSFYDTDERSSGSVQLNEFSQTINRNVTSLIDGLSDPSSGTAVMSSNGQISNAGQGYGGQVYYIDGRNVLINQETTFANSDPVTYIIDGGNLIIGANTFYADNASVGFIVLHDETSGGGNIYVSPEVTDFVGSFYAEGSLLEAEIGNDNIVSEGEIYDGFSADDSALVNQLYIQGLLISSNTTYGSTIDPKNAGDVYDLPNGVIELGTYLNMPDEMSVAEFAADQADCHNDQGDCADLQKTAQRFDIEALRNFELLGENPKDGGSFAVGIQELKDADKITQNIYSKALIIRYDGKVQTATPMGFEE